MSNCKDADDIVLVPVCGHMREMLRPFLNQTEALTRALSELVRVEATEAKDDKATRLAIAALVVFGADLVRCMLNDAGIREEVECSND